MNDFLDLHVPGSPLLIPNPWDVGSARLMESLGARALATTSSGFAATLGRPDGAVSPDEVLAHCAALVAAVGVPVSADLENGFGATAEAVAATYARAAAAGLAGASIEDWSGSELYPVTEAVDRLAAAREAAPDLVLTGRAEGYLHGNPSLADALARLQAYADAGADVLYAPGVSDLDEIRTLVREAPRPVNVLLRPGLSVAALADAGVARISVGGSLAWTAWQGFAAATRAFLAGGSDWLATAGRGREEAAGVVG
ncbi:MAG TPA: isocitrate lyase/phosphoenolpyruvate mutase family protein [Marmoricola sp.]|nr:isocitrate lyase/phosphoenolpyruvate mutase family protein [Marmoricola sp.]